MPYSINSKNDWGTKKTTIPARFKKKIRTSWIKLGENDEKSRERPPQSARISKDWQRIGTRIPHPWTRQIQPIVSHGFEPSAICYLPRN